MADVQIAIIDQQNTQIALAAPSETEVTVAVPGIQGPVGQTGDVAVAQDGTAAQPGIRFENDTNTGIYRPGADQVAVSTGGNQRITVDSSGRLLVGTSSWYTIPDNFFGAAWSQGEQIKITDAANSFGGLAIVSASNTVNARVADISLNRQNGSTDYAILSDGSPIGSVTFNGADGSKFVRAAFIRAEVDGAPDANDMPGRIVLSTTASGASAPTERVRLTNTGALLVGTTTTPTGAGSGAVVAQDRMVISSVNAGLHQVIAGDIGTMTATTGTVVFKFTATGATPRSCYVKLAIANRANNNTPSNLPAAEYAFQLHKTGPGVCSLNGATTVFEFTYVYATHVAFADLGSGECTVTLTNPTGATQTGSYKVEVLTEGGFWTLDSITTT